MFQNSSSCVGWWSPFVCSLRFDLFHKVFQCYKRCLENAWMRLSIVPSIRSRRAVSNGGPLLSVAYDLTCFIRLFERYNLENLPFWWQNLLVTQPLSRKIPITIFSFSNLLVQLHVDSVIMHALMLFPSILGHQKSVTCFLAQVVEQMGLRN